MSGDNVIPFDPHRRVPRTLEPFQPGPYTELHPLWIDGDVKFNVLYPALFAAGLALKLDCAKQMFVITKK